MTVSPRRGAAALTSSDETPSPGRVRLVSALVDAAVDAGDLKAARGGSEELRTTAEVYRTVGLTALAQQASAPYDGARTRVLLSRTLRALGDEVAAVLFISDKTVARSPPGQHLPQAGPAHTIGSHGVRLRTRPRRTTDHLQYIERCRVGLGFASSGGSRRTRSSVASNHLSDRWGRHEQEPTVTTRPFRLYAISRRCGWTPEELEAVDPEVLEEHARAADLPCDDIVEVTAIDVHRPDPDLTAAPVG